MEMDNSNKVNNWIEWRNFVLSELDRLNVNFEKFNDRLSNNEMKLAVEITKLKLYASLLGAGAGLFGSIIIMFVLGAI